MKKFILLALLSSVSAFAGEIQFRNTPSVTYAKTFPGSASDPQIAAQGLAICESELTLREGQLIRAAAIILLREPCKVDKAGYVGIANFENVSGTIYFIK